VQNAVGLVHLPGHGEAQHNPFRASLDDLDVEQLVDVVPTAREESAVVGLGRRGRRHGKRLVAPD
jgi:hypothetical protein